MELRARDVQYREALEEVMRGDATIEALRLENDALRAGSKLSPEQAAASFGVRRITIGRGTAGIDNDRVPGDEGLQVWVEPRDADDHVIKAPGKLQIAVQEIDAQGRKSLLSDWDVDAEKLRQSWKQGLLSIGYKIDLAWRTPPRVENLRVIARWTLPDGRYFEADRDIKVRLLPGAALRAETPQPESPIFRPAIAPTSSTIQPIGHWTSSSGSPPPVGWHPAPLRDVVQLNRPFPLLVTAPPRGADVLQMPALGEIKIED